ncbi:MAG: PHP domain-containing protein [Lachnospiraceae bacterium]|nr:PHP domain-containing protein [Lachnospiraceae bacterium]MCI7597076.1 PHP domain-containing protein [Lachnospiraceae bacterium]MDD7051649.1 PHP domain-containing protein [Lachnospiraceae bacterium]MDY3222629.1 PHP domain-containing protein [Lachnospiraceae bacterium]MDY4096325.1 PHP domain-containing protein [Lachnospiraceae bacterium]
MNIYPVYFDLHTHTISSGHGSTDTLTDLARAAAQRGLSGLGISDHGPATVGSANESYFRNLTFAGKERFGVRLLYGVELNILNEQGAVDLKDELLSSLDYAIISIHPPIFTPWAHKDLTDAYLAAMNHPKVRFLGHIDDARFPSDFHRLLRAAKERGIYPEINNGSLAPDAYRVGGSVNCLRILEICKQIQLPVLLSSDSHGRANVGNMEYIFPLLDACDFPPELVLNCNPDVFSLLNRGE